MRTNWNPRYTWTCPDCKTRLHLRQRVTVRKRRCPECGRTVEPKEIEEDYTQLIVIAVVVVIALIILASLQFRW